MSSWTATKVGDVGSEVNAELHGGAMQDADGEDLGLTGSGGRLVVASNRLPLVLERTTDGWTAEAGSGGLVTAMTPLLAKHGGCWVGWPGTVELDEGELEELIEPLSRRAGYEFVPVPLTEEERDDYYYGFANEVLWPLLHDLQTRFRFKPEYWDAYRSVNRKFARVLERTVRPGDYVWAHDYHLMGVAEALRDRGYDGPLGYFLHTPFPPEDILIKLPWRSELLEALLGYDLLGFQTLRDQRNFLSGLRRFSPELRIEGEGRLVTVSRNDRSTRVGAFPIGIDFDEFVEMARSDETEEEVRRLRSNLPDRTLILSVNRLDYTKGIPNQIRAFATLLEREPELRGRVSLVEVVVPSREHIPEYHDLLKEVERLVGEINGRFEVGGWVPVHFLYRTLDRPELVAYYREADVALVTPLKDGMNLVSKEYCAASVDGNGVLVLSEFAGSAAQLQEGALLVNPYDTVMTAEALRRAVAMPAEERRRRMSALRDVVRREDIHWWQDTLSRAAGGEDLSGLAEPREHSPFPARSAS